MINLAIVGAGQMAREHAKAFTNIDNVSLVGVAGRSKNSLKAFEAEFKIIQVCENIRELYETTNADLVVVAVNVEQTANVLLDCARYPWTILVEKPLGINLAESLKLRDQLGENTRRIFVAFNRRHYSTFLKINQIIGDDSNQRIIKVIDQEDQFAALLARIDKLTVENWMFANSIHLIDLLRQFARGKVVEIEKKSKWKSMSNMKHQVRIKFESGDLGIYECQWNDAGPWSVSVEAGNISLLLKPLEKLLQISDSGEFTDITPKSEWDLKFKPGFRRQAEMMVRQVEGKVSAVTGFNDALTTMQLVHDIYNN